MPSSLGELSQLENLTYHTFLLRPTSVHWSKQASLQSPVVLIDHARLEIKAAQFAIRLCQSYPTHPACLSWSKLAREEMRHYEMVNKIITGRNIQVPTPAIPNYMQRLRSQVAQSSERLFDLCLMAALIEARSCERFELLSQQISDTSLSQFYQKLVIAEARHFLFYLQTALELKISQPWARIKMWQTHEAQVSVADDFFGFLCGDGAG
jgi:tRNA-(ms[2]io[6]A)-hydroxylase